jgi:hypothetical protein
MQKPSYQTVRLAKGKHTSPQRGVCVMELASMLAGEPFTDHPRSVAPSIGALLRGYNDIVDDVRRQDLYRYAADAIGTAGSVADERLRGRRLRAWTAEVSAPRGWWTVRAWLRARRLRDDDHESPQTSALRAIHTIRRVSDETHAAMLELLDELVAIRSGREAEAPVRRDRADRELAGARTGRGVPRAPSR